MDDLLEKARRYFLAVRAFRLPWPLKLATAAVTLPGLLGFGYFGWRAFGGLFHQGFDAFVPPLYLMFACEVVSLSPLLFLGKRVLNITLERARREFPGVTITSLDQVRPLFLAKFAGVPRHQFHDFASRAEAARDLYVKLRGGTRGQKLWRSTFDASKRANLWTLFACAVGVFLLILSQHVKPEDTLPFFSGEGWKERFWPFFLPPAQVVFMSWLLVRLLANEIRTLVISIFMHLGWKWLGNDAMVDYFLAELLKYHYWDASALLPTTAPATAVTSVILAGGLALPAPAGGAAGMTAGVAGASYLASRVVAVPIKVARRRHWPF